jgi:kynurenine formamidase
MDLARLPRYDELPVSSTAPARSSWGLWGDTDRLGSLNLLTPERVLRAASSVTFGEVVSLSAELQLFDPPLFGRPALRHDVTALDHGLVQDETLSEFNTQASSQWDGFRHARSREHGFYNGIAEDPVGIAAWASAGIAGRGVLLDIATSRAQHKPLAYSEPDPITVEDLERAAADQGIVVETGDILIIHTGWLEWARQQPAAALGQGFSTPGLCPATATLAHLWNLHVAAVASDTPALEVWPPGALASRDQRRRARTDPGALPEIFMHADLLALLGIPLGELWETGRLAEVCRRRDRWTFLLTSVPLNLVGGVASPCNAMAIL